MRLKNWYNNHHQEPYEANDGLYYCFVVVFLENEMMYNERMPMSDEALSDNFVLPIGKAKIERAGT